MQQSTIFSWGSTASLSSSSFEILETQIATSASRGSIKCFFRLSAVMSSALSVPIKQINGRILPWLFAEVAGMGDVDSSRGSLGSLKLMELNGDQAGTNPLMLCHPPITKGRTASFLLFLGHPPAPFRSAQIYVIASDLGDMAATDLTLDPTPLTASSRLRVPGSGK